MSKSFSDNLHERFCAAWIGYINQVYLDSIIQGVVAEENNLKKALLCLEESFRDVQNIIHTNRGDYRGVHGFIAEASDVGVRNAYNLVVGKNPNNILVDNNGPVDIIREGIKIQQKFSVSGNSYSLNAARQHLDKYPWFLDGNSRYQIPKDHFKTVKALYEMSESEAARLVRSQDGPSFRDWCRVQDFFATSSFSINDFEPSVLDYADAQKENIANTFSETVKKVKELSEERREFLLNNRNTSQAEAAKVVAIAGAFSGITSLVRNLREVAGPDKSISELTAEDWRIVCKKSGIQTIAGSSQAFLTHKFTQTVTSNVAERLVKNPSLRHITGLQNLATTPAMLASGILSLTFFVANQAYLLHTGKIGEVEFVENCLWSALEVSVGALSSLIGQVVIPIPILGSALGGVAGSILLRAMKDCTSNQEQFLIKDFLEHQTGLDAELNESDRTLVASIRAVADEYFDLLSISFDPDPNISFAGSQRLAEFVGVPSNEILRTNIDIDNYFLS